MSYEPTEPATFPSSPRLGNVAFTPNTDVHEARCLAYDLPRSKTAVSENNPQQRLNRPTERLPQQSPSSNHSRRYSLGLHLRQARACAAQLVEAAIDMDAMAMSESGIALSNELKTLWSLRDVREKEWAEALNFLQTALALEEFEKFPSEKCEAIKNAVEEVLAGGSIDDDDVKRLRRILRNAGFDPWKAISAKDE